MSTNNQTHAGGYNDAILNLLYEGLVTSTGEGMRCFL